MTIRKAYAFETTISPACGFCARRITPRPNQASRTLCRRLAGATWACPVVLVDGDSAPALTGETHHYTTRGGKPVYHPSAYSKVGWSNLVYRASTIRVEVGRDWRPTA